MLVKPDSSNAKAVYAALKAFGAPLEGLCPDDFAEPGKFFRMGRAPVMVDILSQIDGVDFDNAWQIGLVPLLTHRAASALLSYQSKI